MKPFDDLPTLDQASRTKRRNGKGATHVCERCESPFIQKTRQRRRFCSRKCAAAYHADFTRKPRRTCQLCGKPAPTPRQNSCSAKCAYMLRKLRTRRPRTCPVCQREYFHKGLLRLKYCSKRCYDAVRGQRPAFLSALCQQCGKAFHRTASLLRRFKWTFCSRKCANLFHTGANNPFYRGGERDPNRGSEWRQLAKAIRVRDDYTCQWCTRTQAENGQKLSVDHIRPWRSFADKASANDPANLISLCRRCHAKKTMSVERAWLKGDAIGLHEFERRVKLPPLFARVGIENS